MNALVLLVAIVAITATTAFGVFLAVVPGFEPDNEVENASTYSN